MARVLPENVRGPVTVAAVSEPVPLPVRRPPSVVEPVPPLATERVPVRRPTLIEEVATTLPCALVERRPLMMLVMASEVVVALVAVTVASVVLPVTLRVPWCVVLPEVRVPNDAAVEKRLVLDAVVAKDDVEVAAWRLVLPKTVSEPLALRAPPTERSDESVVEPVTARVPVEVAPVVVKPPLNASCVDVAFEGNG